MADTVLGVKILPKKELITAMKTSWKVQDSFVVNNEEYLIMILPSPDQSVETSIAV
jgi:hypothetical protein